MESAKPSTSSVTIEPIAVGIPHGPLDDIKKLGDIVLRRASEKEYKQFMHLHEQCRMKWQATIDKFGQLLKDQEKQTTAKEELDAHLRHIQNLWEEEKEMRRSVESERNFYKMKLNQTYELLRYDRRSLPLEAMKNKTVQKTNDDVSSTCSFLSKLSDVSQTEDDYIASAKQPSESRQQNFNEIFSNIEQFSSGSEDEDDENIENTLKEFDRSLLEKTFRLPADFDVASDSESESESNPISSSEDNTNVKSPSKRQKKFANLSENFDTGKLSDPKRKKAIQRQISSEEVNPNPIYERIAEGSFELQDSKQELIVPDNSVVHDNLPFDIVYKPYTNRQLVTEHEHTFAHRRASGSVICVLCSKKFRFGILAYKCTSCSAYAHNVCKFKLNTAAKVQRIIENSTRRMISEFVPKTSGPALPALIVHCVNEIETRGLSERGLYRVSGSDKEIKALKSRFSLSNDIPDLYNADIHAICGCIKMFLRGLREPLIPTRFWRIFADAVVNGFPVKEQSKKNSRLGITRLPKANRDTLAFLILHLQRIASCPEIQMPTSNLAKVFGPTIVGFSKLEPNYATILGETIIQHNVMQHFLDISPDFWVAFLTEGEDKY